MSRERNNTSPMARGISSVRAEWGGKEGRKGGRTESTEIFLKEKLLNLVIFFTAISSGSFPTTQ